MEIIDHLAALVNMITISMYPDPHMQRVETKKRQAAEATENYFSMFTPRGSQKWPGGRMWGSQNMANMAQMALYVPKPLNVGEV
jgi:hypothetical protein